MSWRVDVMCVRSAICSWSIFSIEKAPESGLALMIMVLCMYCGTLKGVLNRCGLTAANAMECRQRQPAVQ